MDMSIGLIMVAIIPQHINIAKHEVEHLKYKSFVLLNYMSKARNKSLY